jgi:hypothetical protein
VALAATFAGAIATIGIGDAATDGSLARVRLTAAAAAMPGPLSFGGATTPDPSTRGGATILGSSTNGEAMTVDPPTRGGVLLLASKLATTCAVATGPDTDPGTIKGWRAASPAT